MKEKFYKVIITETSSRVVSVSTSEIQKILGLDPEHYVPCHGDACAAVEKLWNDEKIVLDSNDFDGAEFKDYHPNL